jgi:hypothetical protein
MTATTLLRQLRAQGVEVRADGDQLEIAGAKNILTMDVVEILRSEKPSILAQIRGETWLERAQSAIDVRLHGNVTLSDLTALRDAKHLTLCDAPQRAPDDLDLRNQMRDAARLLARQVEGLDLVVRALRGKPIDRGRLAALTVEESWRLQRFEVIERVWSQVDSEPTKNG